MTIQIDIDDKTLAEVDEAMKILEENREELFRKTLLELANKKIREAEVRKQYAEAYRKTPVQPDEFEVEESQLIEVIGFDEQRIDKIDSITKKHCESRRDFIKRAVDEAILKANKEFEIAEKERKAIEAYRKYPIQPDEFEIEEEQLIEVWKEI